MTTRVLIAVVLTMIAVACARESATTSYRQPPADSFRVIERQLTVDGTDVGLKGAEVMNGFFAMAGGTPLLGRSLAAPDFGATGRVMMIGQQLWRKQFASEPSIIGRQLNLDGVATIVVGVMPERFEIPEKAQFWIPMR